MAALTKLMMAVFFIEVLLIALGIATFPLTGLAGFLMNPTDWSSNALSALLTDLMLSLGGIAIIAGTFLVKSDLLVFAGLAGVFYTFGQPLANLWIIVAAQSGNSNLIATIFVSPFVLLYIMTIVAWWRGRD